LMFVLALFCRTMIRFPRCLLLLQMLTSHFPMHDAQSSYDDDVKKK
jgi:hypothetical protein